MTHAPGHDAKGKRENPVRWAKLDAEALAKKRAAGTSASSPGISELAASLGIEFGAGGVAEDVDDPWVIVSRTTPNPDQFGPGVPLKVPQRKKLTEVLKDFYKLKGDDLIQTQARLYRAGFYSGDIDAEDVEMGIHDEESFTAYKRAVARAAAFAEANEDVTLEDILATVSPRTSSRGGGRRNAITVTNPADIIKGVEEIAKKAVGHRLTEAQRAAAVGLWQQLERNAKQAAADNLDGVKPPSFDTFAEDYSRNADPQGAFRQDAISGMNEFYGLLDGVGDGVGDSTPTKGKVADSGGMDPVFDSKLKALIAASGGRVFIKSGHRSTKRQSALWNAALAKYGSPKAARKWVAPPGHSNHERGIAADLGGDLELAARLAPQFGLTRPMKHEPWHFEPVGVRGASKHAYTTPPTGTDRSADNGAPHDHDSHDQDPATTSVKSAFVKLGGLLMGDTQGDLASTVAPSVGVLNG